VARVGLGRVSHLWFGFEFVKFPPKMSIFQFFSLRIKKNLFGSGRKVPGSKADRPLIFCGSKVSSGQGPSLEPKKANSFLILHHTFNVRRHDKNFFLSPTIMAKLTQGRILLTVSSIMIGGMFSPPAVIMRSFILPVICKKQKRFLNFF